MISLADKLKELRKTKNVSQEKFAEYGWNVADAPSDNKQIARNLKSELMQECFADCRNKDWFIELIAKLDNVD